MHTDPCGDDGESFQSHSQDMGSWDLLTSSSYPVHVCVGAVILTSPSCREGRILFHLLSDQVAGAGILVWDQVLADGGD